MVAIHVEDPVALLTEGFVAVVAVYIDGIVPLYSEASRWRIRGSAEPPTSHREAAHRQPRSGSMLSVGVRAVEGAGR